MNYIRYTLQILTVGLLALSVSGCGCDDNEWEVPLVCGTNDINTPAESKTICVRCSPNACTKQDALAVALSKAGGCTQDGDPKPPKTSCSCN